MPTESLFHHIEHWLDTQSQHNPEKWYRLEEIAEGVGCTRSEAAQELHKMNNPPIEVQSTAVGTQPLYRYSPIRPVDQGTADLPGRAPV